MKPMTKPINHQTWREAMNGRRRFLTLLPLLFTALLMQSAFANTCLEYETDVELTGTLREEIFPGPPEWESVERGDKPLAYWILHPDKPICVNEWRPGDLIDPAEKDIDQVQLQPGTPIYMYKYYRRFLNKRVMAQGSLSHQAVGVDVTTVYMTARKIESAP
jgi:hypothetical protein